MGCYTGQTGEKALFTGWGALLVLRHSFLRKKNHWSLQYSRLDVIQCLLWSNASPQWHKPLCCLVSTSCLLRQSKHSSVCGEKRKACLLFCLYLFQSVTFPPACWVSVLSLPGFDIEVTVLVITDFTLTNHKITGSLLDGARGGFDQKWQCSERRFGPSRHTQIELVQTHCHRHLTF